MILFYLYITVNVKRNVVVTSTLI